MDYEKLHKDTINRLQQMVSCGKITVEIARGICADFEPESEDERIRKWCISHFRECFRVTKNNSEYKEYLNNKVIPWLEKQREHKSVSIADKWSEEDELKFADIEALLRGGENCHYNTADLFVWFKSFKDRYTWKPSDLQMKAIEHICDGNYNVSTDILDSIYRDFKKLKKL